MADRPDTEHDRHAIARIILTSGTTGDQRAVALSHDLIWRRIQTYDYAFGNRFPACARIFVDVGIAANSGYLWPIYVLSRGGTVFVRGSDPAETMQALSLYRATSSRLHSCVLSRSCCRSAASSRHRYPIAYAPACAHTSFTATAPRASFGARDFSNDETRTGWVAGGGIEYMFNRNWTAKIEVL